MPEQDYYQILAVDQDASVEQIKESYRQLAFQHHPDRNKEDPLAAEKMKEINEAYAVLSNPSKKQEYDLFRQRYGSSAYGRFRNTYSEQDIFSGSDINHIFEEMAKSFGFRGVDEIFKEFYGQGYRSFEFKKPGFSGRGFVFSGPLSSRRPGQMPFPFRGNLGTVSRFLLKRFSGVELPQNGADIHDVINLDPQLATQGGPYAYFFRPKSKKLVVKIPPGIREGQRIRLAGLGKEGKAGGKSGDLYLKVHIHKPLLQSVKNFAGRLFK